MCNIARVLYTGVQKTTLRVSVVLAEAKEKKGRELYMYMYTYTHAARDEMKERGGDKDEVKKRRERMVRAR